MREEKVHLAVLREYYWSLPSWKAAKENELVSGVYMVVWGSPGSHIVDKSPLAISEGVKK